MPNHVAIRADTSDAPALVRYVFDGTWQARELLEQRRELIRAGQLTARTAVLFDLRAAADIPDLADLHPTRQSTSLDGVWPACRAFVVKTEAQHAGARRLQALLAPQSVINEIFVDESDALAWLAAMARRDGAIRA